MVYKNNNARQSLFIGEDNINHVAKNEDFRVFLGDAFDISLKRTQTNFKKLGKNLVESSHKIEFNNAKDEAIIVNFTENFWGNWNITQSTKNHSKHNAFSEKWLIEIPANSKVNLEYTVRISW